MNEAWLREHALKKKQTTQKKLAMVIDSAKCFNCRACIIACQLENRVPVGHSRNWVKNNPLEAALGMHFQPGNCMHCDKPTCVEACPTGATYKDPQDGVVKIDPGLCIGCKSCIPACPYGARYRHPELKIVDKCDYCESRRQSGRLPACVEVCPTRARVFGDLNDPESAAARLHKTKKTIRIVNPETDTDPVIYYLEKTAPTNWTVEAAAPMPIQWLGQVAAPLVRGLAGLTGLAVIGMLFRQLIAKDDGEAHASPGSGDGYDEK
jgi:tetrathionate reductase subunit B